MLPKPRRRVDWLNLVFLAVVHIVGVGGTALYALSGGLTWPVVAIAFAWTGLTIFSISAGYHRLFSHRAYEAHPLLRGLLLVLGAGAFQTSALTWAATHRRHHGRTDSDLDPYDARRGFWYAHVGWVIEKTDPAIPVTPVPDLQADRWVRWQHRHYLVIGAFAGFGVPALLGLLVGDVWGGLLLGGFARLVFVYQVTFAVNSLAHKFGAQPYSDSNSSRDSLLGALLTMGEGYHNFHHTFPSDYRNGVRLYQFDPTKWILRTLATVGLTRNLRRTPAPAVLRARVRTHARKLQRAGILSDRSSRLLSGAHSQLERALGRWQELVKRYETARSGAGAWYGARCAPGTRRLRRECAAAQEEVRVALARWHRVVRLA